MAKQPTEPSPTTSAPANAVPDVLGQVMQGQARKFHCPFCKGTQFHLAVFGEIVDGVFVETIRQYRCLTDHHTFTDEDLLA